MEKMVNAEFFDALEQLEKEKGIPVDYMLDREVRHSSPLTSATTMA